MPVSRNLVVLGLLILVSAIGVVELRHQNRTAFSHLQSLKQARDALAIEWGKLLLEEGAWSQHRRIESTAVRKLGMSMPGNARVVMVDLRDSGARQ